MDEEIEVSTYEEERLHVYAQSDDFESDIDELQDLWNELDSEVLEVCV